MDIPIKAHVYCTDGAFGHVTTVIIDPVKEQVTHIVIAEPGLLGTEYVVPLDWVIEATPAAVHLRCTTKELAQLPPFNKVEFIGGDFPYYIYPPGTWTMWPFVTSGPVWVPMEIMEQNIPPGEMAIRRGTPVMASDGQVGHVDEFMVDPANGHITHLVLRTGHLWGEKDITIAVDQIDRIEGHTVYLKLDKQSIGALPAIPIHRKWQPKP